MDKTAAAVGTFDGVHKGHQAVIERLKEVAVERDLTPLVITFDTHPLSVIAPDRAPASITTTEKKCDLLKSCKVTPVVMRFDDHMRRTTARQWMQRLHDEYGVEALVVGYDNTFGCDGVSLSIADYKRIGVEIGIEIIEAPVVEGISSSAIRKAIIAGNVELAAKMLGRHFTLKGNVVTGNQLGRTIGFPTANLEPMPHLIVPGNGVYAAMATLPDGTRRKAVVNIGTRPTVLRGDNRTIEAHIIGYEGDLYGHSVSLKFIRRLRDEMKFNSIDALRRQIDSDRDSAVTILDEASDLKADEKFRP